MLIINVILSAAVSDRDWQQILLLLLLLINNVLFSYTTPDGVVVCSPDSREAGYVRAVNFVASCLPPSQKRTRNNWANCYSPMSSTRCHRRCPSCCLTAGRLICCSAHALAATWQTSPFCWDMGPASAASHRATCTRRVLLLPGASFGVGGWNPARIFDFIF